MDFRMILWLLVSGVMVVSMAKEGVDGPQGPHRIPPGPPSRPSPPPIFNPVNHVTINSCCNRTEEDSEIRKELAEIKTLFNSLLNGLQNGEYCCQDPPAPPKDCYDIQQNGARESGVYTIQPDGSEAFSVYCDQETDGGGWTVFQRRLDGSVDFFNDWNVYEQGFGTLEGEHWLGNRKLNYLTNQKAYVLRVDLEDFDENTRFAKYDSFVVAGPSDNYRLQLGSYSGDAGDAMAICDDQQFSTRDRDNDVYETSCAQRFKGGWWYERCHYANLNGLYLGGVHTTYADGIEWHQWRGYYYSLKFTEMKLRPI